MSASSQDKSPDLTIAGRKLNQIVDKDAKFWYPILIYSVLHSPFSEFSESFLDGLRDWDVDSLGLDYIVVSVLGVQSSGKSTLLNLLFGTHFEVMDTHKGRSQTTLGVWAALTEGPSNKIIVLDVEGTDSRERGEDHHTFEQKISLYSLALSEVLIINMWSHDVGRFDGANYGLLKVVFEMNLRLFASGKHVKTLLYFIFRDFSPKTDSIDNFSKIIKADMGTFLIAPDSFLFMDCASHIDKIWNGIVHPDDFKQSSVSDFFDFKFFGMSHKILEENFERDVNTLKLQFFSPERDDFVLDKKYKTSIPADGFGTYAERIWRTIVEEKDLNLPSQKQMLAVYRCEAILNEEITPFEEAFAEKHYTKNEIEKGKIIPSFGDAVSNSVSRVLDQFAKRAMHYDSTIRDAKKEELSKKLFVLVEKLFQMQLKIAVDDSLKQFNEKLRLEFGGDKIIQDFSRLSSAYKDIAVQTLQKLISSLSPSIFPELNGESFLKSVELQFNSAIDNIRLNQIKLLLSESESSYRRKLKQRLQILLSRPSPSMWSDIRGVHQETIDSITKTLVSSLPEYGVSEESVQHYDSEFKIKALVFAKETVEDFVRNIDTVLERHFKDSFEFDQSGLPRQWAPSDNIQQLWLKTKLNSELLMNDFCLFKLDEDLDQIQIFAAVPERGIVKALDTTAMGAKVEANILIDAAQSEMTLLRFRDKAQQAYAAAIKEQEHANANRSIPLYFLAITFVLGLNEFTWLLGFIFGSPLHFIFFTFIASVVVFAWYFSLFPIIGAVLQPVYRAIMQIAAGKLNSLATEPPSRGRVGTDSEEMMTIRRSESRKTDSDKKRD